VISKESLFILENNLVMAGKVNRKFENQFVKIGTTLTIRKPNKFIVSKGPALNVQDINEPSTSVTINQQAHVDFQFTTQDLTLVIEEFSERYIKPAMAEIANTVDYDTMSNWTAIYNKVGTPGTIPSTFASLAAVGQRMDEMACPQDGRVLVLGPAAYWSLANGLIGVYVQSVAQPALKGFLANIANFEIYQDQNVQSETLPAYSGTPTVNGAGQTGSSLVTQAWGNSLTVAVPGTVFTIAGVHSINPRSRQSTGVLQPFTVTSNATSNGSGASTMAITPAIVTSGPYQTVDASPANSAAINVIGSASTAYAQNIAFVKDTFGLVMVPLEIPQGVDFAARSTYKNLSLRILRQYDINNDVLPCRADVLYGSATYYPETGVRLTN
jgi:hypothetical protein